MMFQEDSYKLSAVVAVCAAIVLTFVVVADNRWRSHAAQKVSEMVKAGAHPIDAQCAAFGSEKQICVIRAALPKQ